VARSWHCLEPLRTEGNSELSRSQPWRAGATSAQCLLTSFPGNVLTKKKQTSCSLKWVAYGGPTQADDAQIRGSKARPPVPAMPRPRASSHFFHMGTWGIPLGEAKQRNLYTS